MLRLVAFALTLLAASAVSAQTQNFYYFPENVQGDVAFQLAVPNDDRHVRTCVYRIDVTPEQEVACVAATEYRAITPEDRDFVPQPGLTRDDYTIADVVLTLNIGFGAGEAQRYVARNIGQEADGTVVTSPNTINIAIVPPFLAPPVFIPLGQIVVDGN